MMVVVASPRPVVSLFLLPLTLSILTLTLAGCGGSGSGGHPVDGAAATTAASGATAAKSLQPAPAGDATPVSAQSSDPLVGSLVDGGPFYGVYDPNATANGLTQWMRQGNGNTGSWPFGPTESPLPVQDGTSSDAPGDEPPPAAEANGSAVEVRFSVEPPYITKGESVTLSWSTTNADTCRATGVSGGVWFGSQPTSGSVLVPDVEATSLFGIVCERGESRASSYEIAHLGERTVHWLAPEVDVDGNPLTNLAGFELFYGEESGSYDASIDIPDASATEYELDLPEGLYYFALVAYDTDNVRSDLSNEIHQYIAR